MQFNKSHLKPKDGIVVVGSTLNFSKKYFVGKEWDENVKCFQALKDKIITE